jgi:DNA end-binding protein Ku
VAGKTLWKGYLHFGDTEVPVKLHTAVLEHRLHFHLLHRQDRTQLKQQMVCAHEQVPIPAAEQVKGFEWEDGKYILVEPAEFEPLEPESSRIIEVHEFVKPAQINPIFLEQVYYLEPDSPINRYNALLEALQEMAVAGICTWTMRKRSYLGVLKARGRILRLNTLRYSDEVIPITSLDLEKFPLSEKELKIGSDLIKQLTVPFEPQKFLNEHQEKLQDLIAKKARGEKIALLRPKPMRGTAPDKLLQALEASLKQVA